MTTITLLCAATAITAFLLAMLVRRLKRPGARLGSAALGAVAIVAMTAGSYSFWYHHRPQPTPTQQTLFEGVVYERLVLHSPRPVVVHIVEVDLTAAHIRFHVTPGDHSAGHEVRARTTSEFLREFKLQVAVNASYFDPWHAHGPFDYYPHRGDPVDVYGLAVSQGERYSEAERGYETLYLSDDGRASLGEPLEEFENAVSGLHLFVVDGAPAAQLDRRKAAYRPSPRTAVALDQERRRLMLWVVDGRQPNYSEGLSLPELAEIVVARGGHIALNLDGGGSTTLVVEGPHGEPRVLNSPIHGHVPPGVERPVATHLGIYAGEG